MHGCRRRAWWLALGVWLAAAAPAAAKERTAVLATPVATPALSAAQPGLTRAEVRFDAERGRLAATVELASPLADAEAVGAATVQLRMGTTWGAWWKGGSRCDIDGLRTTIHLARLEVESLRGTLSGPVRLDETRRLLTFSLQDPSLKTAGWICAGAELWPGDDEQGSAQLRSELLAGRTWRDGELASGTEQYVFEQGIRVYELLRNGRSDGRLEGVNRCRRIRASTRASCSGHVSYLGAPGRPTVRFSGTIRWSARTLPTGATQLIPHAAIRFTLRWNRCPARYGRAGRPCTIRGAWNGTGGARAAFNRALRKAARA
jgi:hypothetical protein